MLLSKGRKPRSSFHSNALNSWLVTANICLKHLAEAILISIVSMNNHVKVWRKWMDGELNCPMVDPSYLNLGLWIRWFFCTDAAAFRRPQLFQISLINRNWKIFCFPNEVNDDVHDNYLQAKCILLISCSLSPRLIFHIGNFEPFPSRSQLLFKLSIVTR